MEVTRVLTENDAAAKQMLGPTLGARAFKSPRTNTTDQGSGNRHQSVWIMTSYETTSTTSTSTGMDVYLTPVHTGTQCAPSDAEPSSLIEGKGNNTSNYSGWVQVNHMEEVTADLPHGIGLCQSPTNCSWVP